MNKFFIKHWGLGVIIGLWFLFCTPYFFYGLVPFPSKYLVTFFPPWNASYGMPVKNNAMPDVISQIYPWKHVTIESLKTGQFPLWNPYTLAGTSHAANFQSSAFSPFNGLFLFFPFIDAWSLLILFQPLLAGLFMYAYLRHQIKSSIPSILGSISFMFCSYIVTWMAYGTIGYALLFLPILFLGISREYEKPHWINILLIAGGTLFSLLSGHSQISLYVLVFSFCYILFLGFQTKKLYVGIQLCITLTSGILLAAPQLAITYKALIDSTRELFIETREIIPWSYIVTFISPDFYGNPVTRNDWFGHYAEWGAYIGIVPIILTLYAITHDRRGVKGFFLGAVLISILLAYQSFFSTAIFQLKIPILSTSAASRIIIITSFSLITLSAFGIMDLVSDWKKNVKKTFFSTAILLLILFFVIWVMLFFFPIMPIDKIMVAKRNMVLPTVFTVSVIICMSLGFVKKLDKAKFIFLFGILLCAVFDSYRFASKWMPFDPKEYVYPESKTILKLTSEIGNNRVFGGIYNEVGSVFNIPLIEGYDAMYERRYGQFIASSSDGVFKDAERSVVQFDKHGIYRDKVLQLLGVKYIVHRISDARNIWAFPYWDYIPDRMVSIYKDEHYEVFKYNEVYPRVFLASTYVVERDDQKILDTIFDTRTNTREMVVLEKDPGVLPAQGFGTAEITGYSPNRVTVSTQSEFAKILFLSDVFDEGWNVTIDGKKAELLRADFTFRAVGIPPGNHIVQFTYMPKEFVYGLYIALFAFFVIIFMIVLKIRRRNM